MRLVLGGLARVSQMVVTVCYFCRARAVIGPLAIRPPTTPDDSYIGLMIVSVADNTAQGISVAASLKRTLSLMQKQVVRLILADDEVVVGVVLPVAVNVMHNSARRERTAKGSLGYQNVLRYITMRSRALVSFASNESIALAQYSSAAPLSAFRSFVVAMIPDKSEVVATLYSATAARFCAAPCRLATATLTDARWVERHTSNITQSLSRLTAYLQAPATINFD